MVSYNFNHEKLARGLTWGQKHLARPDPVQVFPQNLHGVCPSDPTSIPYGKIGRSKSTLAILKIAKIAKFGDFCQNTPDPYYILAVENRQKSKS